MRLTGFITVTLDYDKTAEYSGQDIDRCSDLCDLGEEFSDVLIWIPALSASAEVSLMVQRDGKITTVPMPLHVGDGNAAGSYLLCSSSGAGTIALLFHVGAVQFFRIYCGADQTANRTFYVRGVKNG